MSDINDDLSASAQQFLDKLHSGNIDPKLYATYLYNQYHIFMTLEFFLLRLGFANSMPEILRSEKILQDFNELWTETDTPLTELKSTNAYKCYIHAIGDDPFRILSHVVCNHLGVVNSTLSGKIPGSGTMYQFSNKDAALSGITEKIHHVSSDETKLGAWYIEKLFEDLNTEI